MATELTGLYKNTLVNAYQASFANSAISYLSQMNMPEISTNTITTTLDVIKEYSEKEQKYANRGMTGVAGYAVQTENWGPTHTMVLDIKSEWATMDYDELKNRAERTASMQMNKLMADNERTFFNTIKEKATNPVNWEVTDDVTITARKTVAVSSTGGLTNGKDIVAYLQTQRNKLKLIENEFQDQRDASDFVIFADSDYIQAMSTDLAFANNAVSTELLRQGFDNVVSQLTLSEVIMADRMGNITLVGTETDIDGTAITLTGAKKVRAVIMAKDAATLPKFFIGADVRGQELSLNRTAIVEHRRKGHVAKPFGILVIVD